MKLSRFAPDRYTFCEQRMVCNLVEIDWALGFDEHRHYDLDPQINPVTSCIFKDGKVKVMKHGPVEIGWLLKKVWNKLTKTSFEARKSLQERKHL